MKGYKVNIYRIRLDDLNMKGLYKICTVRITNSKMERMIQCIINCSKKLTLKSNFLIPISFQPDLINHRYFKLLLIALAESHGLKH